MPRTRDLIGIEICEADRQFLRRFLEDFRDDTSVERRAGAAARILLALDGALPVPRHR